MSSLCVSRDFLCLSSPKCTLTFTLHEKESTNILNHPDNCPADNKVANSSEDNYDGSVPIVSSCFSSCGGLFALCCHKTLSVWNTNSWELVNTKTIQRSVSKITFSPKNNSIIVADKSGDVYIHNLEAFSTPGVLLLGHVSMLLDVLVTPDEKYIITCDRDEKIRVSCYPNAYNIASYCLGHEEFVTSINLLPKCQDILLSSGGDGTLRLWDYANGKEISCYEVKSDVASSYLSDGPPVISRVALLEKESDVLVSSLIFKINAVWVYLISKAAEYKSVSFCYQVNLDHEPYCIQSDNFSRRLWLLQVYEEAPVLALSLNADSKLVLSSTDSYSSVLDHVKTNAKEMCTHVSQEKFITSMCKKKFDDVQEYYKRKRERIEAEKAKKLLKT